MGSKTVTLAALGTVDWRGQGDKWWEGAFESSQSGLLVTKPSGKR